MIKRYEWIQSDTDYSQESKIDLFWILDNKTGKIILHKVRR